MSINNNPINDNPFVKVGRSLFCGGTIRHHQNSDGTFVEGEKVSVKDTAKAMNESYGNKKKWTALNSDEKLAAKGHINTINALVEKENDRLVGINVAREQQIDAFYANTVREIFKFVFADESEVDSPLTNQKQPGPISNDDVETGAFGSNNFEVDDSSSEEEIRDWSDGQPALEEIFNEKNIDLTPKSKQKFGLMKSVTRTLAPVVAPAARALAPYAKSVAKYAIDCYFSIMRGSKQQDLIEGVIAFEDIRRPVKAAPGFKYPEYPALFPFAKINGKMTGFIREGQLEDAKFVGAKVEFLGPREAAQAMQEHYQNEENRIRITSAGPNAIKEAQDNINYFNEKIKAVNKNILERNADIDKTIDKAFVGLVGSNPSAVNQAHKTNSLDDELIIVKAAEDLQLDDEEPLRSTPESQGFVEMLKGFGEAATKGLLGLVFGYKKFEPIKLVEPFVSHTGVFASLLPSNNGPVAKGDSGVVKKKYTYENIVSSQLKSDMVSNADFREAVDNLLIRGVDNFKFNDAKGIIDIIASGENNLRQQLIGDLVSEENDKKRALINQYGKEAFEYSSGIKRKDLESISIEILAANMQIESSFYFHSLLNILRTF